MFAGGVKHSVAPALAGAGAEEGFLKVATRDLILVEGASGDVLAEVVAQLGGGEVTQDVLW